MRILFDDGKWFINEDYSKVTIEIVKECTAYDERGGKELTSRLYVNDRLAIITDPENFDLLKSLYFKIARLDEDKLYYFDINEEWRNIVGRK